MLHLRSHLPDDASAGVGTVLRRVVAVASSGLSLRRLSMKEVLFSCGLHYKRDRKSMQHYLSILGASPQSRSNP